jgi:hypothetical protein
MTQAQASNRNQRFLKTGMTQAQTSKRKERFLKAGMTEAQPPTESRDSSTPA